MKWAGSAECTYLMRMPRPSTTSPITAAAAAVWPLAWPAASSAVTATGAAGRGLSLPTSGLSPSACSGNGKRKGGDVRLERDTLGSTGHRVVGGDHGVVGGS